MKCVCPMGGDRACPTDCPLAVWAELSPIDRKAQRKPVVEQLYKQGFTMEAIATQLGVSVGTIHGDLVNFSEIEKSKPAKTASNPKGAGRPKGAKSAPSETAKQREERNKRIAALADEGLSRKEIAETVNLGERVVSQILEHENIRRNAKPDIDPATLSMSAQEKLAIAQRKQMRELDAVFEKRVLDETKRRMDEIVLPHWREQIAKAQELYTRRRHLMDKATFNKIRRALHPDSRNSVSDKVLAEAFDAFMGLEKYLLDEKDSPTSWPDIPSTAAEWDKMRRRPKRAASKNGALRPR